MNTNLAYQEYQETELIGGKLVAMSPSPLVNHNRVSRNIFHIFNISSPYFSNFVNI